MRQLLTVLFVLGLASTSQAQGPFINGKHYLEDHPPMYFPEEPAKDSPLRAALKRLTGNSSRDAIASLLGPLGTLGQQAAAKTATEANRRMEKLLRESEDLRQARQAAQQFWLNNPPQVIEYERPKTQPKPRKQ